MNHRHKNAKRPKRFGLLRPKRDRHYPIPYCLPEDGLKCIPLASYARKNNLTNQQVLTLVRKGILQGVSLKRRFFILDKAVDYENC